MSCADLQDSARRTNFARCGQKAGNHLYSAAEEDMLLIMGLLSAIRARFAAIAGLCLAFAAMPAAASTHAGAFQFVVGEVRVVPASGSERPARKGTQLAAGDMIVTGHGAIAQVRLGDGAILVVQPETRLALAEYRYVPGEGGPEKVVFRLEQGGFRSITGAIGRRSKDAYVVETPIARMGVRGTDHEPYYVPAGAAGGPPAGVYNKVNVGVAYIRTRAGEVAIGPSQAGYAASALDAPRLLAEIPSFFNRSTTQPRPGLSFSAPERGAGSPAASVPVVQTVGTAGGLNLSEPSASAPAAQSAPGTVVGYIAQTNGRSGLDLAVMPGSAALTNAGGDAAFGVNWGTWRGDTAAVAGVAASGGVHFMTSSQLTSPAQLAALPAGGLVSATYNYAGGPAPTNQSGVAGSISSLTVGVNFSTQTITNYSLAASAGGASWNASGSGTLAQFRGASGIALKGECSGCTSGIGAPTAQGTAHGALVGANGERMITSFGLRAANQGISGAALLSR